MGAEGLGSTSWAALRWGGGGAPGVPGGSAGTAATRMSRTGSSCAAVLGGSGANCTDVVGWGCGVAGAVTVSDVGFGCNGIRRGGTSSSLRSGELERTASGSVVRVGGRGCVVTTGRGATSSGTGDMSSAIVGVPIGLSDASIGSTSSVEIRCTGGLVGLISSIGGPGLLETVGTVRAGGRSTAVALFGTGSDVRERLDAAIVGAASTRWTLWAICSGVSSPRDRCSTRAGAVV